MKQRKPRWRPISPLQFVCFIESSVLKVKTKHLVAATWMKSPLDQQKFDRALKTRMFHPETRDSAVLVRDQHTAGDSGYDCLGDSKEFSSALSARTAQSNYHRPARLVFIPPLLLQSGCANLARWWHAVKCGSGRRRVGRRRFFSRRPLLLVATQRGGNFQTASFWFSCAHMQLLRFKCAPFSGDGSRKQLLA